MTLSQARMKTLRVKGDRMATRKKATTKASPSQTRASKRAVKPTAANKKSPAKASGQRNTSDNGRSHQTMAKPTSVDEYLSHLDGKTKALLQTLRKTIHQLVPGLTECISYSMPAFRYRGKVIAGFLATKAGASYFPFSGTTLGSLSNELAGYSQTKSALHFTAAEPLPADLVNTLLQTRIAEL